MRQNSGIYMLKFLTVLKHGTRIFSALPSTLDISLNGGHLGINCQIELPGEV